MLSCQPPTATSTPSIARYGHDLLALTIHCLILTKSVLKQCLCCFVLQVLWQPSWTLGCAKTLGEEGEQLFSYLSRLSQTTRNMSRAGEFLLCTVANSTKDPGSCLSVVGESVQYHLQSALDTAACAIKTCC